MACLNKNKHYNPSLNEGLHIFLHASQGGTLPATFQQSSFCNFSLGSFCCPPQRLQTPEMIFFCNVLVLYLYRKHTLYLYLEIYHLREKRQYPGSSHTLDNTAVKYNDQWSGHCQLACSPNNFFLNIQEAS